MLGISLIIIFIGAIVLSIWLTSYVESTIAAILISLAVFLGMVLIFYFGFAFTFLGLLL